MSMNTASSDSSGGNTPATTANTSLRPLPPPSRYESQKRRDWNTFGQYLKNHRPPLTLSRCSGAHVLEFLRYLDQFGKTKVHLNGCPFFGHPNPPAPCQCPLRQAWGSLDALVGRLRAAFEENGGQPETNPFGARAVRLYLREVRDAQSKARGIAYEKKKRKKPPPPPPPPSQQQQQQQHLPGPSSVPPPPSNFQLTDLNTSVAGSYHSHQVMSHTHGHHLFFSDRDAYSGVGPSSSNSNPGGGGGVNRTGSVSPFGGPDERLLLFHCSFGSLG